MPVYEPAGVSAVGNLGEVELLDDPEMRSPKGRPPRKYEIVLYRSNQDADFVAEVPEPPGCLAHGDNQLNALKSVNDATQLWIRTAREFGDPVPDPIGKRVMFA